MSQSGLGALHECLSDVGDAERGLVWRGDLVVDDGGEIEGDIVLGHANLARHFDDLNLDIHGLDLFADGVDLDEARVHGALEAASMSMDNSGEIGSHEPSELGNQANFTLGDRLEWIRATDTAGNSSQESNAFTQSMH